MTRSQLDILFKSLSHTDRRAVLSALMNEPGMTVNHLAERLRISRYALMKHLRLLEDAGLVRSKRNGRNKELHFRSGPIQRLIGGWLGEHANTVEEKSEAASAAQDLSSELNRLLGPSDASKAMAGDDGADGEPEPNKGTETTLPENPPTDDSRSHLPPSSAPATDPLSWMLG